MSIITFQVGGSTSNCLFQTNRQNLEKHGQNYLSILAKEKNLDETSAIFIDRNPKYFGLILDFLRKGKLSFEERKKWWLKDLLDEAKFYEISKLVEDIKKELERREESSEAKERKREEIEQKTLAALNAFLRATEGRSEDYSPLHPLEQPLGEQK